MSEVWIWVEKLNGWRLICWLKMSPNFHDKWHHSLALWSWSLKSMLKGADK